MTTQILKAIFAGIVAGIAIFMLPFLVLRVIIFILLIRLAFRLFGGRSYWGGRRGFWRNPAYASRWHSMSPEERKIFMDKMEKELFAQQNTSPNNS
jgi:hypothetical protein